MESLDDLTAQPIGPRVSGVSSAAPSEPTKRAKLGRSEHRLQLAVSLLLLCGLGFVALSNYLGWTARVEVAAVTEHCQEGICRQRLRVQGSQKVFEVSKAPAIKAGDFVDIEATCTPGCKLAVVAVWLSAHGEKISLMSRGDE